jgi:hypothetical protein
MFTLKAVRKVAVLVAETLIGQKLPLASWQ